ncbi:MAG: accessory gene regulator B family protein [Butyrivibrio sp.]
MIARLSKRIASFFVRNEIIKCEDKEVYEYGLQLLLSTVFNGIIALILAIISGTVLQCICYLAVFVLLRKSAGGFHAKNHFSCCCILVIHIS